MDTHNLPKLENIDGSGLFDETIVKQEDDPNKVVEQEFNDSNQDNVECVSDDGDAVSTADDIHNDVMVNELSDDEDVDLISTTDDNSTAFNHHENVEYVSDDGDINSTTDNSVADSFVSIDNRVSNVLAGNEEKFSFNRSEFAHVEEVQSFDDGAVDYGDAFHLKRNSDVPDQSDSSTPLFSFSNRFSSRSKTDIALSDMLDQNSLPETLNESVGDGIERPLSAPLLSKDKILAVESNFFPSNSSCKRKRQNSNEGKPEHGRLDDKSVNKNMSRPKLFHPWKTNDFAFKSKENQLIDKDKKLVENKADDVSLPELDIIKKSVRDLNERKSNKSSMEISNIENPLDLSVPLSSRPISLSVDTSADSDIEIKFWEKKVRDYKLLLKQKESVSSSDSESESIRNKYRAKYLRKIEYYSNKLIKRRTEAIEAVNVDEVPSTSTGYRGLVSAAAKELNLKCHLLKPFDCLSRSGE